MFKTIKENAYAEITEKKSKFICNAFYVETVEEAEKYIEQVNKKYFDARHNCYAFSISTENGLVNRFSDDGEPSGTAGGPMFNIINSQGISNILVIVTRYFGGILLGTGGLVRAYSLAVNEALEKANIITKDFGIEAYIEVSYSDFQKLQYYFEKNNIKIINSDFKEFVNVKFETTNDKFDFIIENKNVLNFNILKMEKYKNKYIEIN